MSTFAFARDTLIVIIFSNQCFQSDNKLSLSQFHVSLALSIIRRVAGGNKIKRNCGKYIFVTLKQRRFLLWTATRATAVARHGFDCCFSLSSSRSLSLFPPSFFFRSSASRRDTRKQLLLYRWSTRRASSHGGGANANSNSLFFNARATRIQSDGTSTPYVVGASTKYCTDAPVTRLHHLSHGPDRAHCIFRARNRRASRKTITPCERVYKCSRALQISLTRLRRKQGQVVDFFYY